MNYYNFHIGDYRRDTSHLSLLEHGIYRQLIDTYYLSENPIPRETEVVFRRLSARTEEERKSVEIVLNEFFVLTDDGWIHVRCDDDISEYQGKANRARHNGKLGGRPKKTNEVISGFSEKTQEKANQEPITNNQEPITINQVIKRKNIGAIALDIFPGIQDRQLVNDWITVRKKKNAPITKTAMEGFVREVSKSGLTIENALRRCCEQNWAGFKAEWVLNNHNGTKMVNKQELLEESNRASTAGWMPPEMRSQNAN